MPKEIQKEEQTREEQLKELEHLHKDALERRVHDFHRSTKTTFKRLQGAHLKIRDKHSIYRAWHNFRLANMIHWLLFVALSGFIVINIFQIFSAISDVDTLPTKRIVLLGSEKIGNIKAEIISQNNVIFDEKENLVLEDKTDLIGSIKLKADLGQLVSWKDINWATELPEGTSIVYRMHSTRTDESDDWEGIPWSDYYPLNEDSSSVKGIPERKTRYMEMEVVLEGTKDSSPEINYFTMGYTKFEPNKVVVAIKEGLISWIQNVFKFFQKREGIYTD